MADVVIDMLAQGYTRAEVAEWQARTAKPAKKAVKKKPEPQPEPEPEREQQPETDVSGPGPA